VRDGIRADLLRDLDLALGDERPRDRGAEEVRPLIERVCPEHGEDVVAHELFAQIFDEDVFRLDAEKERLLARRLELVALAEIGSEGDDLATIRGLQPLQDDRGIEPARIGEHDLFHLALFGIALRHSAVAGDAGPPPGVVGKADAPLRRAGLQPSTLISATRWLAA
jgi:hypothetical protein